MGFKLIWMAGRWLAALVLKTNSRDERETGATPVPSSFYMVIVM